MQFYKQTDPIERQFYDAGEPTCSDLGMQKDLFFEDAYSCFILGELLYDEGLAPLSNAIPRPIFSSSFSVLFDVFLEAGSFESYLVVFRKIFGDEVEVTFTVPAPGQLEIAIVATEVELSDFVARRIEAGAYVLEEVIDWDGDNIAFQSIKGFQSQYELE